MADIRVEPAGLTISLAPGESLLNGAFRVGWRWPTICRGNGECLLCWVQIVEGEENVVPAAPFELGALDELAQRQAIVSDPLPDVRLACQLQFTGNAVVKRAGLTL